MFSLSPESLLTDTKFRSYRKYFFKTIPSIIDEEKFRRINEFLTSINKKEFYALGQQMIQLNMRLGKLHREGTAITISVIDHHKDIYDLACSCVEKYLKILYGINLAYDGNPYKFNKIKNTPIYEIKSRLQKSNHSYQLLLKPFITIIWNANKHTGTVMNLTNKRIEFIANEGVKWKTYTSFIQLTKELCAVTFLLSRYVFAILLKMIRQLTKRYAA